MIPPLDLSTGLLPVGRYPARAEEVRDHFVAAEIFSESRCRAELWEHWTTHVQLLEALMGREPRTWMAGSFVSAKLDPSDIDVFYGFDPGAYDELENEDLAYLDQLCTRESCIKSFGMKIDAYFTRLPDHLPVDDLRPNQMGAHNLRAFQSLGLYDEIWQRGRRAPVEGSTNSTVQDPIRRGYLEVRL